MLLGLGALGEQGLSSCDGTRSPIPAVCKSDTAQLLLCPELRWLLLAVFPCGSSPSALGCAVWLGSPSPQPSPSPVPLALLLLNCDHPSTSQTVQRGWAGQSGVSPCTLRGPGGERSEDRVGQTAWGSYSTFILHSWALTQLHPRNL